MSNQGDALPAKQLPGPSPWRWAWFVVALLAAGVAAWLLRDMLRIEKLAEHEEELRNFRASHPLLVFLAAFAIYATATSLSVPGATALTLVCAWFFGFFQGVLLVSFASTLGATLSMLFARYFLRGNLRLKWPNSQRLNPEAVDSQIVQTLLVMRLLPFFPFVAVNLLMALTSIKVSTYWWVSQIGMLPATVVYVFAGSSLPSLQVIADQGVSGILTWQLIAALVTLSLFALTIFWLRKRLAKNNEAPIP